MVPPIDPQKAHPSPWVVVARPVARPRMRLFCFPYAGGSAAAYRTWPGKLPPDVEVCGVQFPGRGNRFREPLLAEMPPLLDALEKALMPLFEEAPYAFFGHSMGALVSFELCRQLERQGGPLPVHLVVSGRNAPHLPDTRPPRHTLSDAEFMEQLRKYGGTPEEVLRESELMELLLPILRADFRIIETWEHAPGAPLEIPISAFGGIDDPGTSREHLDAWRIHCRSDFALHLFPGDHFFIQSGEPLVLGLLSRVLAPGFLHSSHSQAT